MAARMRGGEATAAALVREVVRGDDASEGRPRAAAVVKLLARRAISGPRGGRGVQALGPDASEKERLGRRRWGAAGCLVGWRGKEELSLDGDIDRIHTRSEWVGSSQRSESCQAI